jgi:ribonuclease HI
MTTAFTDGAARGNPGPAGWGAVVYKSQSTKHETQREDEGGYVKEVGGRADAATNNQMELKAVCQALEKSAGPITLYVDSQYVINGATKWHHGWKKRNWQTKAGDPVKNQKLWKRLLALQANRDVNFSHVTGHAGIAANERADDIATAFADGSDVDLYDGPADDYTISLSPESTEFADAPVYLSLVGDKLYQDSSWSACQKRVQGSSAKFKKVFTETERAQVLEDWGVSESDLTIA